MKFIYPYKLYLVGLILFILVSTYGFFQICDLAKSYIFLIALYVIFCVAVSFWYYENYSYYKSMYVLISKDSIVIKRKDGLEEILELNLEYIIEANHRQQFKIHNVVHIFTKDGKYFYLTNEINSFKKLKSQLNSNFNEIYIKKEKTISGNFVVTKENLINI